MTRKKQILQTMGIDVWEQKMKNAEANNVEELNSWELLEKCIRACTLCSLHKTKTKTVFGVGNRHAKIMFIGEAPGANEDLQGEPFVGKAGMLLNEMLHAISLNRSDVYITNILKCRPPNNREPLPEEVKLCTPCLKKEIELVNPKIIVAVGRVAAHFLLNTDEAMTKLRGKEFSYGARHIPLIVTYHPAYLLRSPREKSKAYADFLAIQAKLGAVDNSTKIIGGQDVELL